MSIRHQLAGPKRFRNFLGAIALAMLASSAIDPTSEAWAGEKKAPSKPHIAAKRTPKQLRAAYVNSMQQKAEGFEVLPLAAGLVQLDNSKHRLGSTLDVMGINLSSDDQAWSLSMHTVGIGCEGGLSAVSEVEPVGEKNLVRYRRGENLEEVYVNGPLGVEQQFVLSESPACTGPKVVTMQVDGDLSLALYDDDEDGKGDAVRFVNEAGRAVLAYTDLFVTDATGKMLPAWLTVGAGEISIHVDDDGAKYPLTIDPLIGTEQAKFLALDGALGDEFGNCVSLDGDTAIVGSYADDIGANTNQGSAYVFVRSGSTWSQQAKLTASDGAASDLFGSSVSISGNTAIVGAYSDDNGANADQGSVYVFVRNGSTWTQQAKLVASDGAASDLFGYSSSLSADTALIGAYGQDIGGNVDQGAAYVFVRNGTTWTQQAKLVASDGATNDNLAESVALSGDTALVGAYLDDVGANANQGSAYVFVRNGTTWTQQAQLTASDGLANDGFGGSLSVLGDTALIGAYLDDIGTNANQGSVYAFARTGATWSQQAKLTASDGAAEDRFGGRALSLLADKAVIGARLGGSVTNVDAGAAYVFSRNGASWTQQTKFTASDGANNDEFGHWLSASGNTAFITARGDDIGSNTNQGSVYFYALGKTNGDACGAGAECASGFCADSVCCNSVCGGSATNDGLACSVAAGAATDGTCGMLVAGRTRTTTIEYDPVTGFKSAEVSEPDDPQLAVRTAYTRDNYGNALTTVVSSTATGTSAITTRTTDTATYLEGRVATTHKNALGQTTSGQFDSFNNPTYINDLNGVRSNFTFDMHGRKTTEKRPDGTFVKWDYYVCGPGSGCTISTAKYLTIETHFASDALSAPVNGPWKKTYQDELGRVVRTETVGFDGTSVIIQDMEYNSRGKIARQSRPYYSGSTIQWTTYSYDVLNRLITTTAPDNSQTKTTYNGLTTVAYNQLNQTKTSLRNGRGELVKVTDYPGNSLTYQYDPFGQLTKTVDPDGNTTWMAYDIRGNMLSMTDPDRGTSTNVYDVLGELKKQTDAKGNITTFTYDLMARPTNRTEPDLVSTYTYDSCYQGKGRLCTISSNNGYSRTATFDALARPSQSSTTIEGTGYSSTVTYDANGRKATQSYPTGLTLKYGYTSLGYLQEVRNNATNALYWTANSVDAEGHLLQQTYGNGIATQQTFDPKTGRTTAITAGANNSVQNMNFTYSVNGNMLTRDDVTQSLSETFVYDSIRRLTSNTVTSPSAGTVTQTYWYDKLGNIVYRSDVGWPVYGAVNNRPHGITYMALVGGGKRQYTYDNNGNVVQEVQFDAAGAVVPSKGRTETYTSFDVPSAITTPSATLSFSYGPEHQRFKQVAPSGTTIYVHPDNVGGLSYEKETKTGGSIEHRHFVTVGGSVVALVKQVGSVNTNYYLHRDHLGSTTAITNDAGTVLERLSYEPFGKRRTPAGALDANNTLAGTNTDRGYTNHEHLDDVGLIHMNGRVYDPTIGRFLSADLLVANPTNIQSFNRYAYTLNNPLVFVDPSGWYINPLKEQHHWLENYGYAALVDAVNARNEADFHNFLDVLNSADPGVYEARGGYDASHGDGDASDGNDSTVPARVEYGESSIDGIQVIRITAPRESSTNADIGTWGTVSGNPRVPDIKTSGYLGFPTPGNLTVTIGRHGASVDKFGNVFQVKVVAGASPISVSLGWLPSSVKETKQDYVNAQTGISYNAGAFGGGVTNYGAELRPENIGFNLTTPGVSVTNSIPISWGH